MKFGATVRMMDQRHMKSWGERHLGFALLSLVVAGCAPEADAPEWGTLQPGKPVTWNESAVGRIIGGSGVGVEDLVRSYAAVDGGVVRWPVDVEPTEPRDKGRARQFAVDLYDAIESGEQVWFLVPFGDPDLIAGCINVLAGFQETEAAVFAFATAVAQQGLWRDSAFASGMLCSLADDGVVPASQACAFLGGKWCIESAFRELAYWEGVGLEHWRLAPGAELDPAAARRVQREIQTAIDDARSSSMSSPEFLKWLAGSGLTAVRSPVYPGPQLGIALDGPSTSVLAQDILAICEEAD